jgi:hypothetical protein
VSSTALWLVHRHREKQVEDQPALHVMPVCDLVQKAPRYFSRVVRVQGTLVGYHELLLFDEACKNDENYIRVDLDAATRKQMAEEAAKLGPGGMRQGNFWLQVVLLGRLEPLIEEEHDANTTGDISHPHPITYRYHLIVFAIDRLAITE